jgi:hypothetical protein
MNTTATTTAARRVGATSRTTAATSGKPAAAPQDLGDLGKNLNATIEGNELIIRINLDERLGESSTGKSITVATTSGNQKVGDTEVVIGINAYVKKK